jgi:hypothetical protein
VNDWRGAHPRHNIGPGVQFTADKVILDVQAARRQQYSYTGELDVGVFQRLLAAALATGGATLDCRSYCWIALDPRHEERSILPARLISVIKSERH